MIYWLLWMQPIDDYHNTEKAYWETNQQLPIYFLTTEGKYIKQISKVEILISNNIKQYSQCTVNSLTVTAENSKRVVLEA